MKIEKRLADLEAALDPKDRTDIIEGLPDHLQDVVQEWKDGTLGTYLWHYENRVEGPDGQRLTDDDIEIIKDVCDVVLNVSYAKDWRGIPLEKRQTHPD